MDTANNSDGKQGGNVEEGQRSASAIVAPGPPPVRPGPPPIRADYHPGLSSRKQKDGTSSHPEDGRTERRDHQHRQQEDQTERRGYESESRDRHRSQRGDHDNYYEDRDIDEQHRRPPPATQLRLVKIISDVLPEEQKVALIDGRNEVVSIGRDRSFTARIRCPSMEISKHHANIFRMANDKGSRNGRNWLFAVADTGSTHGTYILLDSPPSLSVDSLPPITAYERLSPPKKASIPKCLRHLSLLRVGKTVFQAHLHPGRDNFCEDCAINEESSNEILLQVHEKKESKTHSLGAEAAAAQSITPVKVALKQAMRELKSRHLGEEAESEPTHSDYVDRAAARRARGGGPVVGSTSSIPVVAAPAPLVAPVVSVPAAKLDASNRGYQMFSSMSGKMGELPSHDPVLARGVEGRAGLGSKRLLDVQEMAARPSGYSPESVRERQRRRFDESR